MSSVCNHHRPYDDGIDLCCDDMVIYGAAIGGWGCCGRRVYLLSRDLCCSGTVYNVQYVETSRKQCCGTELLDPRNGICCDNVTLLGEVLCPGTDAQNKRKKFCSVSLHIFKENAR